ncbi:MAG TPA: FAD/NAD(P)-binding protein [Streptosporangiaceae bacterium]|nr:FAD/NAD(P)-binding protein [Streptosporangiaceae bacterium]
MFRFVPRPELLDSEVGRQIVRFPGQPRPPAGPVPGQADVVIVGAGLAGTALGTALWHAKFQPKTVILDPSPRPAGRFLDRVSALHQRVLRSPYEHHAGAEGHRDCELADFARAHWSRLSGIEREQIRMAQSGQRSVVPVDVFAAYTQHVAICHELPERTHAARVRHIEYRGPRDFAVHHDAGVTTCSAVVLATGEEAREIPPQWLAHGLPAGAGLVVRWDQTRDLDCDRPVVVGKGLSAANLVWSLCHRGAQVTWLIRGTERYQCADVDARYFRPEGRASFMRRDLAGRMAILDRERRPTVMFEFQPLFDAWEREGRLRVQRETVIGRLAGAGTGMAVTTTGPDGTLTRRYDRLYAALGVRVAPPPTFTGTTVRTTAGLPVLDDTSSQLESVPGAFGLGILASLSIGPAARNIDGIRIGVQRIVAELARW